MDSIIGILRKDWLELLKKNKFKISFSKIPQSLIITYLSGVNTKYKKREDALYGQAIEQTPVSEPPLFILGHWRSGTTFLQSILANDDRFASPKIYECRNPHTFLVRQNVFEKRVNKMKGHKRPTDNVVLSINSPGEEEFAVAVMSLKSPLFGWMFPKNRNFYERYLTFDSVTGEETNQWESAYMHFLKKLTFKYKKTLLLKSPVNTARVKHLIKLFPNAKFVHIHRHPYEVYRSTEKMYRTAVLTSSFQGNIHRDIQKDILDHYKRMHQAYFRDRVLIPEEQLLEIRYQDLDQQPLNTVRLIYEKLNLPSFEVASNRIGAYLDSLKNYKKNEHPPLPEPLKAQIQKEWEQSFSEWGYDY
ncbi:sulfotransferase [candidate division KSB1 bacterium]|nr:MAG: sulfotransferase [candidate division KSB1 bacterium]